jgi:hypothetical protein
MGNVSKFRPIPYPSQEEYSVDSILDQYQNCIFDLIKNREDGKNSKGFIEYQEL